MGGTEQQAADRGAEGGGDARARAASDELPPALIRTDTSVRGFTPKLQ